MVRLSRGDRRQRDGFRGGNQQLKEDLEEGLSRLGNGDAKALGCRSPCLGIGAEADLLHVSPMSPSLRQLLVLHLQIGRAHV